MRRNKKILFIVIGIITIFIFTSITVSNIFLKEKDKIKIKSQNNTIGIIVEGQEQEEFPSKQNYAFEKAVCNGVEVPSTDTGTDTFNINISGITTKSNCTFYFMNKPLIKNVAEAGDFVAYTPSEATWTNTVAKPTTQGNFGGWTAGQDKSTSVTCYNSNANEYASGWRVLSNDGETVKLISAGTPECYYNAANQSSSVILLTATSGANAAITKYGSNLAESVKYFDKTDLDTWYGSIVARGTYITDSLIKIGSWYYFTSVGNSSDLWDITNSGGVGCSSTRAEGLRPLITLKPNIQVDSGDGTSIANAYQISL